MNEKKRFSFLVGTFIVVFFGIVFFSYRNEVANLASVIFSSFSDDSLSQGFKWAKPPSGIYTFGGDNNDYQNSSVYFNDVFFSKNGSTWSSITNSASWSPRATHGVEYLLNSFWLVGGALAPSGAGSNDIYNSPDGKTWTKITPNSTIFNPRFGAMTTRFKSKIWVMGGWDYALGQYSNEVWSTPDGINWKQEIPNGPIWSGRQLSSTANLNGEMYVVGGVNGGTEIWKTADGKSWTHVDTDIASQGIQDGPWSPRWNADIVAWNDGNGTRLWFIGGIHNQDIWVSDITGTTWTHFDTDPNIAGIQDGPWPNHIAGHKVFVFKNKLYVLGGQEYALGPTQYTNMATLWSTTDAMHWQIENSKPLIHPIVNTAVVIVP